MANNINVLPKGTRLLNGKREYKVEEVLGTGGFGITYKVSSTVMVDNVAINTFFAMKEYFLNSCYRDKDNVTMMCSPTMRTEVDQSLNDFITEAKRLNSLGHKSDNIVKVNEVFKENGTAYYIMEYLDGGNLQDYVRKKGALKEAEAIAIIKPIAKAVEALHEERILHLDIKPGNIVLKKDRNTDKDVPVLIDFGLVKHFDSKGKPTTRIAAKGASDGFAPMEQYTTIDKFAPTLDVYALGATLYYMLKGATPPKAFDIESSKVIMDALPSSVSEITKKAIVNAMEKSKFERTATVADFLSTLGDSVDQKETATASVNTTIFNRNSGNNKSNKKRLVFVLVVVVLFWGLGSYFLHTIPQKALIEENVNEIDTIGEYLEDVKPIVTLSDSKEGNSGKKSVIHDTTRATVPQKRKKIISNVKANQPLKSTVKNYNKKEELSDINQIIVCPEKLNEKVQ